MRRPGYTWAERRRRRVVVEAWVSVNGLVCPGLPRRGIPPHSVARFSQLSADHVFPVAYGGAEGGPIVVRCLACNSRRRGSP